jgi:hypothetical protein
MRIEEMIGPIVEMSKISVEGYSLPNGKMIAREWARRGWRGLPDGEQFEYAVADVRKLWKKLREKSVTGGNATRVVGSVAREATRNTWPPTARVEAGNATGGVGSAEWEARIKEMKYEELCSAVERNGLSFMREGGNVGIRTMRARNCLYTALRRGIRLT